MIEAVVVDCDGTSVDSERLCFQALVDGLAGRGVKVDPRDLDARYAGCDAFEHMRCSPELIAA